MIAKKREQPVCLYYRENNKDNTRSTVDNDINKALVLLAVMFSGDNHELDMSDLTNFLSYTNVTEYPPMLSMLDFHSGDIELDKDVTLVSVATLTDIDKSPDLDIPIEYQAVGYMNQKAKESLGIGLPIHGGVTLGYFNKKINDLTSILNMHQEARSTVINKSIVDKDDDHTDEGVIL